MDFETFRNYCLVKKGVTEKMPFVPEVLVFKVVGKMFALTPLDVADLGISLKNTPDKNQELRAEYPGIHGAWHMNKTHWSMFLMNEGVPSKMLRECVDDSYDLVVKSFSKSLKAELDAL